MRIPIVCGAPVVCRVMQYLSDEWLDAAAARLARCRVEPPVASPGLEIHTVVHDVPDKAAATVEYRIFALGDRITLTRTGSSESESATERSVASPISVRFTQTYRTAAAVCRGEASAQAAFMTGDIRLGGDVSALISNPGLTAAVGDVFENLRASSTFA